MENQDKIEFRISKIERGMLSSPQIWYLAEIGILFTDFDKKHLGPASYHMRISGPIITKENGKSVEIILGDHNDINSSTYRTYVLKPNTLTFITTYEKFNLPPDFIARFNLKSKWVHKGLLLGTGPIVDPEVNDRLLIPLHNFSDSSIEIRNMDEILSVEFTRTLDPSTNYTSDIGTEITRVENKSSDYNFFKYIERMGGMLPESSVLSTLNATAAEREKTEKANQKMQKWSIYAALALIVAMTTLVVTTWMIFDSSNKINKEAIQTLEIAKKNISESSYVNNNSNISINESILGLQRALQILSVQNFEANEMLSKDSARIIELETKIYELTSKIKMIQNATKSNPTR